MPNWLFKEEPDHYAFTDLQREGSTLWDGVTNALAQKHLRQVRRGDRILYYHTGKQKAVVGEMVATADPTADPPPTGRRPADRSADGRRGADPKLVAVRVRPVRPWPRPVTLAQVKADPQLADWALVRLPRLSVLPVTDWQWRRLAELAGA
jgi:predicted RNA-binding protein with PUA-like domain